MHGQDGDGFDGPLVRDFDVEGKTVEMLQSGSEARSGLLAGKAPGASGKEVGRWAVSSLVVTATVEMGRHSRQWLEHVHVWSVAQASPWGNHSNTSRPARLICTATS